MTDFPLGFTRSKRLLALVFGVIVAAPAPPTAIAADMAASAAKEFVEGTWQLEEWNVDGNVLHPPLADGRFSLHDGVVMYFQRRRSQDTTVSLYGYGTYVLSESSWSYHYDYFTTLIEDSQGTHVSKEPPWPGVREFKFLNETNKLILDNGNGRIRLVFEKDHFDYVEDGNVLRRWKRVGS